MTGLELYAVIAAGVTTGLAAFQWVVLPLGNFVGSVREYVASKTK